MSSSGETLIDDIDVMSQDGEEIEKAIKLLEDKIREELGNEEPEIKMIAREVLRATKMLDDFSKEVDVYQKEMGESF